jgi:hypothetical protein
MGPERAHLEALREHAALALDAHVLRPLHIAVGRRLRRQRAADACKAEAAGGESAVRLVWCICACMPHAQDGRPAVLPKAHRSSWAASPPAAGCPTSWTQPPPASSPRQAPARPPCPSPSAAAEQAKTRVRRARAAARQRAYGVSAPGAAPGAAPGSGSSQRGSLLACTPDVAKPSNPHGSLSASASARRAGCAHAVATLRPRTRRGSAARARACARARRPAAQQPACVCCPPNPRSAIAPVRVPARARARQQHPPPSSSSCRSAWLGWASRRHAPWLPLVG